MRKKRTCLLVLGMHRSGTSTLTRILNIGGASPPATLMRPSKFNETGYWESYPLVLNHDAMLDELDSAWYDWRPLNISRLPKVRQREIKAKITSIIEDEFGQSPLFVIKDPRICRFVPLFLEALTQAGIKVHPIIIVRNPLEVCHSLEKRDGMSRLDSSQLWLRHVLEAERETRGMTRSIVTYDQFMSDWKSSYAKITTQLDAGKMADFNEISSQVDDFLSPNLRHYTYKREDLLRDQYLHIWVRDAYDAMLALVNNPRSPKAFEQLDNVSDGFSRLVPILQQMGNLASSEKQNGAMFDVDSIATLEQILSKLQSELRPGIDEADHPKNELEIAKSETDSIKTIAMKLD